MAYGKLTLSSYVGFGSFSTTILLAEGFPPSYGFRDFKESKNESLYPKKASLLFTRVLKPPKVISMATYLKYVSN